MAKASVIAARQAQALAALAAQQGSQASQLDRIEAKLDGLIEALAEGAEQADPAGSGEIPQSTPKKK